MFCAFYIPEKHPVNSVLDSGDAGRLTRKPKNIEHNPHNDQNNKTAFHEIIVRIVPNEGRNRLLQRLDRYLYIVNIEIEIYGNTTFLCTSTIRITVILICCLIKEDNGSSSSQYSFKIDKNKENQTETRVHVFQTWKKQLSECQTQTD